MGDFRRLLTYILPYKKLVMSSVFCHVMMALFTVISIPLIIPFFQVLFSRTPTQTLMPDSKWDMIGWLEYYFVGILETHGTDKAILMVCGAIVVTFLLKNLFRYLAMYFMVPVRSNVVMDLRSKLYNHYLHQDYLDNQHKRGDLITRITSDVQEVEWSILRFIETIFKSPVVIIGSIFLMISINAQLTIFVFVLMLFTGVVIGTLSKTLKKQSLELQEQLSGMTSTVDESIEGSLIIDIFQVRSFWKKRFEKLNNAYGYLLNKVSWRQDLSSPLSEFLGVSVVVVLLWYGSKLVLAGELLPETFFAFIFAFYNVIEPSKSFSSAFYNVKKGAAALERIDNVLIEDDSMTENNFVGKQLTFNKKIKFKNVSFSYDKEDVLSELNLTINAGERIAIVGPSGAGKSTITKLLLNKISAQSGQVLIDDIDINEISKKSWYKQIGMVTQKAFLYHDTVRNNVTLGREGISDERIWTALEQSHSAQFVRQMRDGLDTIIGDRGEQVSGGEQQRLTIARALLQDPSILIFDEPTSALDAESEEVVSQAIGAAFQNRTVIVIAHRISTIKQMDRILVLKDGQIMESGRHEELIKNKGIYADYVALQSLS